ncbi:MAG: hypothetical protein WCK77_09520 [Verrucomicrobiota bacterium]
MKRLLIFGALIFALSACPASAILDTNNNKLSDLWERKFNNNELFPEGFDPQADPDGDGWTNEQEAIAGTDPFDSKSPNGFVRPKVAHIAAVLGEIDESGTPELITPEAVTITWLTIPGKQYTLLQSADLSEGSWHPVEPPFIGNGSQVEYSFPLTQDDGTIAENMFRRLAIEDVDTDGDGLTDAEEFALGADPYLADSDGDGWNDRMEIANGTSPTNPDTNGDGIPDSFEIPPTALDKSDLTASLLMVISPQQ